VLSVVGKLASSAASERKMKGIRKLLFYKLNFFLPPRETKSECETLTEV